MDSLTKAQRRELRLVASRVEEADCRRALSELAAAFDDWREGKMSSIELHQSVHSFHRGPGLELFQRYTALGPREIVALGIARGLLDESVLSAGLRAELHTAVEALRSLHVQSVPPG